MLLLYRKSSSTYAAAADGVKFNSWMAVNCSAAITSHYPCIYNSNSTITLISNNITTTIIIIIINNSGITLNVARNSRVNLPTWIPSSPPTTAATLKNILFLYILYDRWKLTLRYTWVKSYNQSLRSERKGERGSNGFESTVAHPSHFRCLIAWKIIFEKLIELPIWKLDFKL